MGYEVSIIKRFNSSSILKRLLEMVIAGIIFCTLVYVFFGRYIRIDNHLEYSRRALCVGNLLTIRQRLQSENIPLNKKSIPAIQSILDNLGLKCISGQKLHVENSRALYRVVELADEHVVITEDVDNHNSEMMEFTDCPYVRYCLFQADDSIELGRWENKDMSFEKIIQIQSHER